MPTSLRLPIEPTWDPEADATAIGVIVKDGVVMLTGHLGNYAEKHAAEKAAQRVEGVRVLATELNVRLITLSSIPTRTSMALLSALWTGTRSYPPRSRQRWRNAG